jgi:2-oxoacid dehydrogenases acyltransferase (catalytic domain)
MYLALTYDHRILDGREAVTFLAKVRIDLHSLNEMLTTHRSKSASKIRGKCCSKQHLLSVLYGIELQRKNHVGYAKGASGRIYLAKGIHKSVICKVGVHLEVRTRS